MDYLSVVNIIHLIRAQSTSLFADDVNLYEGKEPVKPGPAARPLYKQKLLVFGLLDQLVKSLGREEYS